MILHFLVIHTYNNGVGWSSPPQNSLKELAMPYSCLGKNARLALVNSISTTLPSIAFPMQCYEDKLIKKGRRIVLNHYTHILN